MAGFLKLASMTTQTVFSHRMNITFDAVGLLFQILLLKAVWTAVYADRGSVGGVDLTTLLTFLTIANLQVWVVWPETTWLIQAKVRTGAIALDVARPLHVVAQLLAHQVGSTMVFLPLSVVLLPFAFVVGVLTLPPSPEAGLLYLASLTLAYAVVSCFGLLMGAAAFWTLETSGIQQIYRFANLFFAGGLVPLWLFPDALRTVAELLPFRTQADIPVSIYVGRLSGADAVRGLAIEAVWVALLALLVGFVWSRALRKVVVQGG